MAARHVLHSRAPALLALVLDEDAITPSDLFTLQEVRPPLRKPVTAEKAMGDELLGLSVSAELAARRWA